MGAEKRKNIFLFRQDGGSFHSRGEKKERRKKERENGRKERKRRRTFSEIKGIELKGKG